MVIMFFARNRMMHGIKEDLLDRRQTDDHLLIAIDNSEAQSLSNDEIQTILVNEGAVKVKGNVEAFNTSLTTEEDLEIVIGNNEGAAVIN